MYLLVFVFVCICICLCLFVNSPSLLLVSEARHQKGRENKSGPARHCLSYITHHCTLDTACCMLHTARHVLSYITANCTQHIAHCM